MMQSNKESSSELLKATAKEFDDAWRNPDVAHFVSMLHPDVVLKQPVLPPIHGKNGGTRFFQRFLKWLPDVRGEVLEWSGAGDTLYIVWLLEASVGGKPFSMRAVDVIRIDSEGLIMEREAFYDSLHFFKVNLSRPFAWIPYWRFLGVLPGGG